MEREPKREDVQDEPRIEDLRTKDTTPDEAERVKGGQGTDDGAQLLEEA